METVDGVVATSITYVDQVGFVFQEVDSTTASVVVYEGQRKYEVESSGAYQLTFIAANFSFADPPIGFPEGQPDWLTLDSGYTSEQFSMLVQNSGQVENQTGKFLIHAATLSLPADSAAADHVIDPTVVNNPNPSLQVAAGRRAGAERYAQQRATRA
jgi:hypothetical protein